MYLPTDLVTVLSVQIRALQSRVNRMRQHSTRIYSEVDIARAEGMLWSIMDTRDSLRGVPSAGPFA